MRTDNPEQFERAAQLEDELNRRRRQLSRDPVYLTDALIPLRRAVMDSDALDLDLTAGECDSGWCMT